MSHVYYSNSTLLSSSSLSFALLVSIATTHHRCRHRTMQALQYPTLRASPLEPFRKSSNGTGRSTNKVAFISATAAPKTSAPKREKDPKKRVVITGMGLTSVFGNDVDTYYDKLLSGESGIGPIDRFDASKFPTRFGGQIRGFSSEGYIDGKNDRRLDDCLRYCIVAGKKALEDADLGDDRLSKVSNFPIHSLGLCGHCEQIKFWCINMMTCFSCVI